MKCDVCGLRKVFLLSSWVCPETTCEPPKLPSAQEVIDGIEWAKHKFSKVDMCQEIGCHEVATYSVLPDNAADPHMPSVTACDKHIGTIGFTSAIGDPVPDHWIVHQIKN